MPTFLPTVLFRCLSVSFPPLIQKVKNAYNGILFPLFYHLDFQCDSFPITKGQLSCSER